MVALSSFRKDPYSLVLEETPPSNTLTASDGISRHFHRRSTSCAFLNSCILKLEDEDKLGDKAHIKQDITHNRKQITTTTPRQHHLYNTFQAQASTKCIKPSSYPSYSRALQPPPLKYSQLLKSDQSCTVHQ